MWGKIKARLTSDARYWYKMWSSWLALLWGAVVYFFWTDPTLAGQVYAAIPQPYRGHLGAPIAVIVSAMPIIVRCLRQGKLTQEVQGRGDSTAK